MKGSKDLNEYPVKVWMTKDMLEALDLMRRSQGLSRSSAVRKVLLESVINAQREFFMDISADRARN